MGRYDKKITQNESSINASSKCTFCGQGCSFICSTSCALGCKGTASTRPGVRTTDKK